MASRSSDTVRLKPDTTLFVVVSTCRWTLAVVASAFKRPALAAAFLALSLPVLAQQADRVRTEALARRATERLQSLQREADRLASEERTLLGDLRKLELERQIRAEELKRVDADAAKVQKELDVTAERMAALEATDKKETPEL